MPISEPSRRSLTSAARAPAVETLALRYQRVRGLSELLCTPLEAEDFVVQPMENASPPKWHLAHTSWFFETFLLKPHLPGYQAYDEQFAYLFNSYYNGVGRPFPRPRRGHLSRPTVAAVFEYRAHVDRYMQELLEADGEAIAAAVVLGLHHEQQHQELLLTDIKYNLGLNPLAPAYLSQPAAGGGLSDSGTASSPLATAYSSYPEGLVSVGALAGDFFFDNESPRHTQYLHSYALANTLVTNGEFLAFMEDGGYDHSGLWLSDGWAWLQANTDARSPLYWREESGRWFEYRLSGLAPLQSNVPVTHVSFYEADAFARWSGARLPLEHEWEFAASQQPVAGNFLDSDALHPLPRPPGNHMAQLFGDVWEWTASPYVPYPGFEPLPGTLGEYNGKFMSNQLVLRGGSCVSSADHLRASYRNFFYPADRWQFSGIRLAKNI